MPETTDALMFSTGELGGIPEAEHMNTETEALLRAVQTTHRFTTGQRHCIHLLLFDSVAFCTLAQSALVCFDLCILIPLVDAIDWVTLQPVEIPPCPRSNLLRMLPATCCSHAQGVRVASIQQQLHSYTVLHAGWRSLLSSQTHP